MTSITAQQRTLDGSPGGPSLAGGEHQRAASSRPPPLLIGAPPISIKIVGVGGAGGNVIDRIVHDRVATVDVLAVNTDRQALLGGRAPQQLVLGETLTRGLGAGGDPQIGQRAAKESTCALHERLRGADLVFVAAGMGGGTGTGAAPVVAAIARKLGALTVALVTRPFAFEGRRRAQVAEQGIAQLRAIADTVIIVPNDRLLQASGRTTSFREAFGMADTVLRLGVQGIVDLTRQCGLINVDFADVRAIMGEAGPALLGIGIGRGTDRALEAIRRAMACPLLEGRLDGARRLLLNISGGPDLGLLEVNSAAEAAVRHIDPEANIIFGAMIDPTLTAGQVKVTLVATGFNELAPLARPSAPARAQIEPLLPAALRGAITNELDPLDLPPFLLRFRKG